MSVQLRDDVRNIAIIAHVGRHIERVSEKVILANGIICAGRNQPHAPAIALYFVVFYE